MLRVGLTGGIGSGKSLVADRLGLLGAVIIDTDLIAHRLTQPGGRAIDVVRRTFGAEFIDATGAMDRARMRALVFADDAARKQLEAILHPSIRADVDEQTARAATASYVVQVVPLLVESGDWRQRIDRVLVIDCSAATQIERVTSTRGLARGEVQAIIDRQASRARRLAAADDVLVNDGSALAEVLARADRLHRHYMAIAHPGRPADPCDIVTSET